VKTITRILCLALFAVSFSLANASAVQVWECSLKEGKTFDDLQGLSSAWLAATRSMEGGEKVEAYMNFSLVGNSDDGDFNFVVITPGFDAWGKLTEAYPGSAAQKADEAWSEVADCTGNTLWASERIE